MKRIIICIIIFATLCTNALADASIDIINQFRKEIEANNKAGGMSNENQISFKKKWKKVFSTYIESSTPGKDKLYYLILHELMLASRDLGDYEQAMNYSNMFISANGLNNPEMFGPVLANIQLMAAIQRISPDPSAKTALLEQIDKLVALSENSPFDFDLTYILLSECGKIATTFGENDAENKRALGIYEKMIQMVSSLDAENYAKWVGPFLNDGTKRISLDEPVMKYMRLQSFSERKDSYKKFSADPRVDKIMLAYELFSGAPPNDKTDAYGQFSDTLSVENLRPYNFMEYISIIHELDSIGRKADAAIFADMIERYQKSSAELFKNHIFKDAITEELSKININAL